MVQKVRINDKKGNFIAEIELATDEYNNIYCVASKNIANKFVETEQTEQGFIEVLDVDIDI